MFDFPSTTLLIQIGADMQAFELGAGFSASSLNNVMRVTLSASILIWAIWIYISLTSGDTTRINVGEVFSRMLVVAGIVSVILFVTAI